jgi:hypothetical protein
MLDSNISPFIACDDVGELTMLSNPTRWRLDVFRAASDFPVANPYIADPRSQPGFTIQRDGSRPIARSRVSR